MQQQPEKTKAPASTNRKGFQGEESQSINKGTIMSNSTALTIGATSVRQLGDLYSLNDLHKASGGEDKHQPAKFVRLDQTQALIAAIENSPEVASSETARIPAVKTKEGRGGGTYGCKELVIAYAAWISATFHLKVIRVFLKQMTPTAASRNPAIAYDCISPAQAQDLKEIVEAIVKAGVQGFGETWARLHRKFKVNSYLELPATVHLDARKYLIEKLPKGYDSTVVDDEPSAPRSKLDQSVLLQHAFTLAAQTAAKVQQAVFSGVMSGNADWKHSRYLVNLSAGHDEELTVQAKQIEGGAYVATLPQLTKWVQEPGMLVESQDLMNLAAACMSRLAQRMSAPVQGGLAA